MLIRKKAGLIFFTVATALLHGCGGGGGGSSSSGPVANNTSKVTGQDIKKTADALHQEVKKHKKHHQKDKDEYHHQTHESHYKGYEPDKVPFRHLMSQLPYKADELEPLRRKELRSAYVSAVRAYKGSAAEDSPKLDDLVVARYFSINRQGGVPEDDQVSLKDSASYDSMLRAINDVANLCRAGKVGPSLGDAGFIKNQSYLTRSANHGWHTHTSITAQIRQMDYILRNGGEIGENAPMLADASHSQAMFTGLEDDHWYVYGQAYAFRGHWEPEEGLKQEYKGEGAEFGTFRSMGNGFLLGGMFGLQKVRMEADFGLSGNMNSDAQIYRVGPFVSWSNDHWTVDSMLTYGWVSLDTSRRDILNNRWKASPKGSEWAGHLQASYSIPLDHWTMGLSLVPEAFVGYRMGTIEKYAEKSNDLRNSITESKHKGLTTRLGSGVGYMFPDLSTPTNVMLKAGVQKTHGWEDKDKSSTNTWPSTPKAESRDTAMYYSLALNRQFGADLDKMIGLEYAGTSGDKSASDALMFSYRQAF